MKAKNLTLAKKTLNLTSPTWRDIPGWEGLYAVSESGQILSKRSGALRRPGFTQGYYYIPLHRNGSARNYKICTLVAMAFIGPRPPGQVVRHLDGNSKNDHVSNLTWGTYSENNLDTVIHGNHHNAKKSACKRGHHLAESNLVKSVLRQGRRNCLACSRGEANARDWGITDLIQIKEICDKHYTTIDIESEES